MLTMTSLMSTAHTKSLYIEGGKHPTLYYTRLHHITHASLHVCQWFVGVLTGVDLIYHEGKHL